MSKKEQLQKDQDKREIEAYMLSKEAKEHIQNQTKDICEKYGVKIKQMDESVGYQMDRFCTTKNAYFYFKQKATVERTLKAQNEYMTMTKRASDYQAWLNAQPKVGQIEKGDKQQSNNKWIERIKHKRQSSLNIFDSIDKSRTKQNYTTIKHYNDNSNSKKFLITQPPEESRQQSLQNKSFSITHSPQSGIYQRKFGDKKGSSVITMTNESTMKFQSISDSPIREIIKGRKKSHTRRNSKVFLKYPSTIININVNPSMKGILQRLKANTQVDPNQTQEITISDQYTTTLPLIQKYLSPEKSPYLNKKRNKAYQQSLDIDIFRQSAEFNPYSDDMSSKQQLPAFHPTNNEVKMSLNTILSDCKNYQDTLTITKKQEFPDKLHSSYNQVDQFLLEEKLRQENLMKITQDIGKLTEFKPQMLKVIYKDNVETYLQQCETEKLVTDAYVNKKMDTRLQKMLERKVKRKKL